MVIMSLDNVDISRIDNWRRKLIEWAHRFYSFFDHKTITTYIHLIVDHSEHFMKRLYSLQKTSSFALEAKHQLINEIYHHQSDFKSKCPKQILEHLLLDRNYEFPIEHHHFHTTWTLTYIDKIDEDLKLALPLSQ